MSNFTSKCYSVEDEILDTTQRRPHCFIIGAGASLAALPNGDKYGRPLPLMNNLSKLLGIDSVLRDAGIAGDYENFESLYASLLENPSAGQLVRTIEQIVYNYFCSLRLPDYPTLYDHLVLSLRPKDVIATFNWDPFIIQAIQRVGKFGGHPRPIFLHGNVAAGYCLKCKVKGVSGQKCEKCGEIFQQSKLLYPVTQKNYSSDPFIANEWDEIRIALQSAYVLTIFGYSAPSSDVEAVRLLQEAWGLSSSRNLEQIEFINKEDSETHVPKWSAFVHSYHYSFTNNFYASLAAQYPRRSCEALFSMLMLCMPPNERKPFPRDSDFPELFNFFSKRIQAENSIK